MKVNHLAIKKAQEIDQKNMQDLLILRRKFILDNVPRVYGLMMLAFPRFIPLFNYSIAENKEDRTKLTLLRGRKVVARNFNPDLPSA